MKGISFITLLILSISVPQILPVLGAFPDLPCLQKECLFEGVIYFEGSIIYCDCRQLICQNNNWELIGVDPNCCTFQGELYPEGFILELGCFRFICKSSNWTCNSINEECPKCYASTDPNIFTFDQYSYVWNGKCNYTLSQPFNCTDGCGSYFPPYGIYGDFGNCFWMSSASCVDITTYKVDPHTAVVIDHSTLSAITINNNFITVPTTPTVPTVQGYSYPVIIWYDGYCVYIIGPNYAIIACPNFLIIYTIPESINKIAGLCGFYSNNIYDDLLTRYCQTLDIYNPADIPPFAQSWMTLEMDFNCTCEKLPSGEGLRGRREVPPDCEQYRKRCEEIVNAAFEKCGYPVEKSVIIFAIESCINDCCTEPYEVDFWINEAFKFACLVGQLSRKTT